MRIKQLLKDKKIASKDMAKYLGVSTNGLSIMLGPKGNPSLKRLKEIAKFLNVETAELFADTSNASLTCPNCGKELIITIKE